MRSEENTMGENNYIYYLLIGRDSEVRILHGFSKSPSTSDQPAPVECYLSEGLFPVFQDRKSVDGRWQVSTFNANIHEMIAKIRMHDDCLRFKRNFEDIRGPYSSLEELKTSNMEYYL
jgi:hypothetical protein